MSEEIKRSEETRFLQVQRRAEILYSVEATNMVKKALTIFRGNEQYRVNTFSIPYNGTCRDIIFYPHVTRDKTTKEPSVEYIPAPFNKIEFDKHGYALYLDITEEE